MISGLIGGVTAIIAWQLLQYFKEKRAEQKILESVEETIPASTTASQDEEIPVVKDIVLDTLHKLQCQPVVDDSKEGAYEIVFEYQAERFNITVEGESLFITLRDLFWYTFESDDIEQFSVVKKIINDINWNAQVSVCYSKTNEDNKTHLHTVTSFICNPGTDFKDYLQHILQECFIVHNHFYRLLAESRVTK